MTLHTPSIDAPQQITPVRWERVREAREKLERGDYDRVTDVELEAVLAELLRPRAEVKS